MRGAVGLIAYQAGGARTTSAPGSTAGIVPTGQSFDDYDFSQVSFPEGYGADDLMSLAFVDAAQDFVFHGQTGRGKTHLAIAVGNACVQAGRAVRFFTTAQLVLMLVRANRDHALEPMLRTWRKPGSSSSTSSATCPSTSKVGLLFQVMTTAVRRGGLIVALNVEVQQMGHGARL